MRLINSFLNANPLLAYKVGAIKMHEATKNNLKEWSVEDLHSKFNKCFIRIDTNYLKSS